jgi:putative peptide maturation system protein
MNESLRQAVSNILDYLSALQQDGAGPREARARLQPLRGLHPDLQLDLLAEEQAFDQSVHYDVLLRRAGEGTVSVSYCPERVLPWPLRGVHRWNEGDLLRVNGNVLPVDAALACLDFIWDDASIIERLVHMCLIQEELARNPIDLTDAELQDAIDRFRAAKKLFKAEDTLQWLEQHGMSQERLERYVSESAIVPKLRDRISAGRVDEYFREHQHDFDVARIARLEVPDAVHACELAEQIRSGALNFFAAAERLFSEAAERDASAKASLFDTIERRQASAALRNQLFSAAPGQLIGPVPVENGHALMRVLAIVPARLDGRTQAWLTERREATRIEWCWGNASKTSA